MPVATTTTNPIQSRSPSPALIEKNDNDDCQPHVSFLPQHHHLNQPNMVSSNKRLSSASPLDRTPARLLELKQQRVLAAANRKKRMITRLISVVGLLIILLCAVIVTLTLKMAPKIDELVRTRTGTHQSAHLMSRMSTPLTTTKTNQLNNFTRNNSSK
jgi:hypothetical protein